MLEDMGPTARRVFGGAHPFAVAIGHHLRDAQATLHAAATSIGRKQYALNPLTATAPKS